MEKKKHNFKAWLFATRPWSFPASAMPVVVTLAYLYWMQAEVNLWIGLWTLLTIVVFHAAGNTWSDYQDYQRGVDREDTVGGMSITSGEFCPEEIRRLSILLFVVALCSGLLLAYYTGLPTLCVGVAGVLLMLFYPWLKYHALGDLDIFLTYSLLPILGTSYVTTGTFFLPALWLVLPIGLITVGILHVNNSRDIACDRRAGIYTLAMLLGEKTSAFFYAFVVLTPFLWTIVLVVMGIFPWLSLVVLLALKVAIDNVRKALRFPAEGMKVLIGVDEATAQLQLMYSLLLAVSFVIASFI